MAGRNMSDKAMYAERIRILIGFKLQLPLETDVPAFTQRFEDENPWMRNKPTVVLLKAGQITRGLEYLDGQISSYRFNMTGHSKEEYINKLGFSLSDLGDPEDKLRRERAQERATGRKSGK